MVLGIYGSGGLGREVFVLARQINAVWKRWDDVIFLDDFHTTGAGAKARIISFDEAKSEFAPDRLEICVATGEPAVRAELYERVRRADFTLATLTHPEVHISEDTSIGLGTIICAGSFVSCGVRVGENVLLQPTASVGHDCRVGSHTVISTFVSLAGNCAIGTRAYIGMNVPVKEGTVIGDDAIIGMGSVVLRNIDAGMVALGNPARPMSVNQSKRVFRK